MAIKIVQSPVGPAGQVTLPERIEVAQILRSTKLSEKVVIEYHLPPASGLRFEGKGEAVQREETIARADTPLHHRLEVERATGSGALRVTIDERILDPEGQSLQVTSFDLFVI